MTTRSYIDRGCMDGSWAAEVVVVSVSFPVEGRGEGIGLHEGE